MLASFEFSEDVTDNISMMAFLDSADSSGLEVEVEDMDRGVKVVIEGDAKAVLSLKEEFSSYLI